MPQKVRNLVRTPKLKIPLGEAVELPGGGYGLRLKHGHGKNAKTETLSLDGLHKLVYNSLEEERQGAT